MSTDRVLIRIKDGILVIATIGGLIAGGYRFYVLPQQIQRLDELQAKHDAMIVSHDTQLAVVHEQFSEIIRRLDRIERESNRRRE